jgi:hypothetical protein
VNILDKEPAGSGIHQPLKFISWDFFVVILIKNCNKVKDLESTSARFVPIIYKKHLQSKIYLNDIIYRMIGVLRRFFSSYRQFWSITSYV